VSGAYAKTTIGNSKENQWIKKQSALFRHAFNTSNLKNIQNTYTK
jgi:hypothetical protein